MDQDSNQMESSGGCGPVQCRNGCGFYSNAGTDGLCSVCYKDCIKKKQQPPTNMPASLAPHSSMAHSGHVSSASPSQMASLSIGESSMASAIASSVPSSSPTNINKSGPISVETAAPTVILPSSSSTLQTEKRNESESDPLEAAASVSASALGTDAATIDDGSASSDGQSGKKKKNRCFNCKKKVGLTGFSCRCGGLFCSMHRYSDKHECNFDYKEHGAEEIRKSNPVVVAKKVQKI